jgi:hypothetical protein
VVSELPVSTGYFSPLAGKPSVSTPDSQLVELSFLLPLWQAEALEEAAFSSGITAAQMLRKLIGSSLKGMAATGV